MPSGGYADEQAQTTDECHTQSYQFAVALCLCGELLFPQCQSSLKCQRDCAQREACAGTNQRNTLAALHPPGLHRLGQRQRN